MYVVLLICANTEKTFFSDVGFFLNGVVYSNNSVVPLQDIGEGTAYLDSDNGNAALFCITNLVDCCRGVDGGSAGEWYLPGESVPVVVTNSADFISGRGPSAVLLHRMNSGIGPTGVYTCKVPDENGVVQQLYIGVGLGIIIMLRYNYYLMITSSPPPVHSYPSRYQ